MRSESVGLQSQEPLDAEALPGSPSGVADADTGDAGGRSRLPSLWPIAAVMAGGMIGAVARVALSSAWPVEAGRFPLATFAENVLGALLLGFMLVWLRGRRQASGALHAFVCTGMLGSFTTFSNLSVEWVSLAGSDRAWLAVVYPLVSVITGLGAAMVGMALARAWSGAPIDPPTEPGGET